MKKKKKHVESISVESWDCRYSCFWVWCFIPQHSINNSINRLQRKVSLCIPHCVVSVTQFVLLVCTYLKSLHLNSSSAISHVLSHVHYLGSKL